MDIEDYELLEMWYGLLFGEGKKSPEGKDVLLYNKLSQMHIGKLKEEVDNAKKGASVK